MKRGKIREITKFDLVKINPIKSNGKGKGKWKYGKDGSVGRKGMWRYGKEG